VLPSNLLMVWKRKGNIQPRYATQTSDALLVSKRLIDAYRRGVGEKKGTLRSVADALEDEGYDYRLVRGLSLLLDRRGVFKCVSQLDPPTLRRKIFQAVGASVATDPERRRAIVEEVTLRLKVTSEQVEESMYADLDSELILQNFESPNPEELVRSYNISLTQTLLFDATELRFTVAGNWQKIFFKAKRLGLIYEAYKDGEVWIKIDGPVSLFKLTRRYGTAIAKLLPFIINAPKWTLEAKILWKFTNEICTFRLESLKYQSLFGAQQTEPAMESFDSKVEEDFANRFQALDTGWQLKREPEPIIVGQHVLIPDFSFEREGAKLYMEVVGYWTAEYLKRKIEKLKKTEERVIVAVDKNLACDRLTKLENQQTLNIIYFQGKIPLSPILRTLQEDFKEIESRQTEFLRNLDATFTEPIIKFEDFAAQTGTSIEAVKNALTEKIPPNYALLPDGLIRRDRLEQIREKLDQHIAKTGKLRLVDAVKIAQTEQVELTSAIQVLGYRIVWHGIDIEKAEVTKTRKTD
jgi:predicted nuclease of restriction endonuclease-like RecB superfamily